MAPYLFTVYVLIPPGDRDALVHDAMQPHRVDESRCGCGGRQADAPCAGTCTGGVGLWTSYEFYSSSGPDRLWDVTGEDFIGRHTTHPDVYAAVVYDGPMWERDQEFDEAASQPDGRVRQLLVQEIVGGRLDWTVVAVLCVW